MRNEPDGYWRWLSTVFHWNENWRPMTHRQTIQFFNPYNKLVTRIRRWIIFYFTNEYKWVSEYQWRRLFQTNQPVMFATEKNSVFVMTLAWLELKNKKGCELGNPNACACLRWILLQYPKSMQFPVLNILLMELHLSVLNFICMTCKPDFFLLQYFVFVAKSRIFRWKFVKYVMIGDVA